MTAKTTLAILFILAAALSLRGQSKCYQRALSAFHRGDYSAARNRLGKIAQHDNNSKILLAKALYQLSDYTPIAAILRDVQDLDSDARMALATSHHMAGHFEEARVLWKTLLDHQNAAIINSNIGDTFYGTGDIDSSLFYIDKAIALDPVNDLYVLNAGIAYSALEESSKACANLFLSAMRGNIDAIELHESENCISWENAWLKEVPGNHLARIANNGLAGIHQPVISVNEVFYLKEHGHAEHVVLKDIVSTNVGIVLTFAGDENTVLHRWVGFNSKPSFLLTDVSSATAGR